MAFNPIRRPGFGAHDVPKAHDKDPRALRYEEYSPRYQADQEQFAEFEHELRRQGFASFEDAYKALKLKNLPPQVRQIPFAQKITVPDEIHILIPQNLFRMGFTVANPQTAGTFATFHYGNFVAFALGAPLGITLGPATFFQESNGTVSIDDIYITGDTANMWVVGFEATLAIEGQFNK